jgi:hypothetical protein
VDDTFFSDESSSMDMSRKGFLLFGPEDDAGTALAGPAADNARLGASGAAALIFPTVEFLARNGLVSELAEAVAGTIKTGVGSSNGDASSTKGGMLVDATQGEAERGEGTRGGDYLYHLQSLVLYLGPSFATRTKLTRHNPKPSTRYGNLPCSEM